MRLDKFLVECGIGSRKEVKKLISDKQITVNGNVIVSPKENIDEINDEIKYAGEKLEYKEFRYYILNKKAGYITAVDDPRDRTVMELLPDWVIRKDLAPVGRLDKDTEGLLLLTNDGQLNHKLLSPKSHVEKKYYAELEKEISEEDIKKLEAGVDIGGYITMPAKAEKIDEKKIFLTIKEGKFHQVKKMLEAVGNKVIYLKRVSFGKLELKSLMLGEVKEIKIYDIV
ncbi:Ribosomal small subunit pseudouridine synthase A [Fusobacterium sp. DD29]|uniref:pseudouridine synthase n=1 Tax=unclassified Fusobacterium TaxID=2648384 RepID=UPI001B8B447A|nr:MULTISPECIES: pseudouridine synthase [unclassified Fusobacterium]MBR8702181.1 Ribosomal small subunit pseudouridine synthase A [Fusobacterium sp. DD45]MBR8712004.1 Ribosomal small subunit pseudouridine synthase A [Fusobacterium sp. DD28]MBR8749110.1 Ribosomal small subunit pseudouridine synthase A [Fusobacterium sp. DD29]MBR8752577.1 Ribosomal small subunit pseudouridine synthase A [Fusobacterium sp. DD26]MBR8761376.1 Ribosomal small subunit pseudouridine synthase A [Fusobacterium sp. DD25]